MMPEQDAIPAQYLVRLERLVRSLLRPRFESAEDIWLVQERLLNLQREIQDSISCVKRERPGDLDELARLRWGPYALNLGRAGW